MCLTVMDLLFGVFFHFNHKNVYDSHITILHNAKGLQNLALLDEKQH